MRNGPAHAVSTPAQRLDRGPTARDPDGQPARRIGARLVGWSWLALWTVLLVVWDAPWQRLGGVLAEPARWGVRVVLFGATLSGFMVAAWARDVLGVRRRRSYLDVLRVVLLPVAAVLAAVLVYARVVGAWPLSALAGTGLFGYWAGLDIALAAWPLMHGARFRPHRPIEPFFIGGAIEAGDTPPAALPLCGPDSAGDPGASPSRPPWVV